MSKVTAPIASRGSRRPYAVGLRTAAQHPAGNRVQEFEHSASSWMAAPVYSIAESARLVAAATLFDELGVSALPVVDVSSRLTGLISRADLIRAGRLRVSSQRGEPLL